MPSAALLAYPIFSWVIYSLSKRSSTAVITSTSSFVGSMWVNFWIIWGLPRQWQPVRFSQGVLEGLHLWTRPTWSWKTTQRSWSRGSGRSYRGSISPWRWRHRQRDRQRRRRVRSTQKCRGLQGGVPKIFLRLNLRSVQTLCLWRWDTFTIWLPKSWKKG